MKIIRKLLFLRPYNNIWGILARHNHQEAQSIWESGPKECPEETSDDQQFFKRSVALTAKEYNERKLLQPVQPLNPHILKVAILGEPNAGKSTLTNRLMKWKVCSVSKKVHTTRKKASLILVEDNKQIVFVDTPGFITPEHSKKHHLEATLVADPEASTRTADLIAVIVDGRNKWTNKRIHEDILRMLEDQKHKKSILVINKIDAQKNKTELLAVAKVLSRGAIEGQLVDPIYKKKALRLFRRMKDQETALKEILEKTEKLEMAGLPQDDEDVQLAPIEHSEGDKGWPAFTQVFMVSALNGEGVDELRDYLFSLAKPGDWEFHESNVCDIHPYNIAKLTIREVLLEELPQEIPYSLELNIDKWILDDSHSLHIHMTIGCPKPRYKTLVIGKSGRRIANLVERARQSLQDTFRSEIYLRLELKVNSVPKSK